MMLRLCERGTTYPMLLASKRHTVGIVSMHPVARLVQDVHSMAMAANDSLLRARPSEGAVLSLHKVDPQSLWCVGDEAPQVSLLIGLVHVSNACQVQAPYQLPGRNNHKTSNNNRNKTKGVSFLVSASGTRPVCAQPFRATQCL